MKSYFTIILLLVSLLSFSQSKINGVIKNRKGEPIFAANVYLKSAVQNGVTSNFDGNFSLCIGSLKDTIIVSFIGYETKEIPIESIDISKIVTVILTGNSQTLDEVIITAQDPISEKFAVNKIKKLDIYFNPMSQGDALKAITILPASTTVDESANPSLRGSSPDRTRVMLNGVPVYAPVRSSQLNNQGFFSLFNTEIIHKQYVYASNPPLTYGNTSAGLVEIQTLKKLQQNLKQFTVSIGGIGCLVSQKIKRDEAFVQIYGNLQKSDAFIAMQKENLPHLKAFTNEDIGLNYHNKLNDNIELNSFNYFINESFKVDYPNLNYRGEANAHKKRFYTVNNLNFYSTKGVFSFNSGFNASKQNFRFGNIISNNEIRQVYLSLNYKKSISKNSDFQTGIAYEYHKTAFNDSIPLYYFAVSPNAPNKHSKNTIKNHIIEPYVYMNWKLNNEFSVSAGLRTNIPAEQQNYYLNSQISMKYKFNNRNSCLLSAGNYHSYSTPNYYSKKYVLLSAQQLALDYSFTAKKIGIKAAAYYKNEKGEQALNSYESIDKIESFGVELYTDYKVGKYFKITASNLFIDQQLNVGGNKYKGSYDFKYLLKLSLQYANFKWFTASISFIARPGKYYTPITKSIKKPFFDYIIPIFDNRINTAQYNSYNKVDFTINRYTSIGKFAIIPFLSVTNIFNFANQSDVYYNEDYSKKFYDYYGRRVVYFGVILNI